jgi:hypothetical protein
MSPSKELLVPKIVLSFYNLSKLARVLETLTSYKVDHLYSTPINFNSGQLENDEIFTTIMLQYTVHCCNEKFDEKQNKIT